MHVDLILAGGRVYPVGRHGLRAMSHLAVVRGRVVAIGGAEIMDLRAPRTRVVELRGRAVLPGFDDAHAHVVYSGLTSFGVRLGTCRGIAEIQERLRAASSSLSSGEWLQGRGYARDLLAEKRQPTAAELDAAVGSRPCFIDDRGGHVRVANSAALAAAGINASTADPAGGVIGREEAGMPNGLLLETAMRLVADVQPPPTLERRRAGILRVQRLLLSRGITSVGAAVNRGFADDLRAYQQLAESRQLRIRVNQFLSWELLDAARGVGVRTHFGSPLLRAGPVKVFVDGGATGGAARRSGEGIWRTDRAALRELVASAQRAGLQVAAHAIGDGAIEAMLDAVEAAGPAAAKQRHRIEHFTLTAPDLRARAAALGVVAVMQPLIVTRRRQFNELLDGAAPDFAPHRSIESAGVRLAFSSDLPVTEDPNPWHGIGAALNDGEESLSLLSALRAYTHGGAYAAFAEGARGSLEPGLLADFQVYARDPVAESLAARVPKKENRPVLVALGGVPVFRRGF